MAAAAGQLATALDKNPTLKLLGAYSRLIAFERVAGV